APGVRTAAPVSQYHYWRCRNGRTAAGEPPHKGGVEIRAPGGDVGAPRLLRFHSRGWKGRRRATMIYKVRELTLWDRFRQERDERARGALIERHAPLVGLVRKQQLGDFT